MADHENWHLFGGEVSSRDATSRFSFQPVPAFDHHGVDVARDDILMNMVTKDDQLMNDNLPWRGPREKSVLLMQMLIKASTSLGDLVVDCTAATSSFSQR